MTTINVAGTSVNYSATGAGPGLVFVHGTSVDAQGNFGHVVDRFADQRRVICPNYGGAGHSTIPDGSLALDTLVEQIAGTIRHAATAPVDLVGDSLGAVVAAATAARYPALVRKLVLVAGWADSGDARHKMVFDTWARLAASDAELASRYGMALAVKPAFLTALGEATIAALSRQPAPSETGRRIDLGSRIDIRDAARTITAPTLIIRGSHDYLIPPYQTALLRTLINNSQDVEVDSGHAVFLEKGDEVVAIIREFLFAHAM
ncbi:MULTISPECIES: alpha/beta fold hydrolase [Ralstonia]|nr:MULTISPECIES: alpha/beta hydrolase [Ralstonia]MBY4707179.1 alpha/beta hydrolase [Ralstonia insidiosa]